MKNLLKWKLELTTKWDKIGLSWNSKIIKSNTVIKIKILTFLT